MTLTGREIEFYTLRTDIIQQSFDILRVEFFRFHMERKRIDSLIQYIQCFGICLLRTFHLNFLTNEPFVIVLFGSSQVGKFSGKRIGCFQSFKVFHPIERFYLESFVCLPNEFLLKISALEVGCHFLHPLFCRYRRKIREEFFFTVCHSLL